MTRNERIFYISDRAPWGVVRIDRLGQVAALQQVGPGQSFSLHESLEDYLKAERRENNRQRGRGQTRRSLPASTR